MDKVQTSNRPEFLRQASLLRAMVHVQVPDISTPRQQIQELNNRGTDGGGVFCVVCAKAIYVGQLDKGGD
jgi:hypothetical protein